MNEVHFRWLDGFIPGGGGGGGGGGAAQAAPAAEEKKEEEEEEKDEDVDVGGGMDIFGGGDGEFVVTWDRDVEETW